MNHKRDLVQTKRLIQASLVPPMPVGKTHARTVYWIEEGKIHVVE